jgi:hypothetical protein
MKSFLFTVVALFSSLGINGPAWGQSVDAKTQFEEFYSKFQARVFKGRAQGLSAFNLDLQMIIHYQDSLSAGGGQVFNLASDGNLQINGAPVFPMSGRVVFEVLDSNGRAQKFMSQGEEVILGRQPFTTYLVESDAAYATRIQQIAALSNSGKDLRFEQAKGRMVAVVKFDIQKQNIRFFQVDANHNLISSGVFDGAVTVPKASYF